MRITNTCKYGFKSAPKTCIKEQIWPNRTDMNAAGRNYLPAHHRNSAVSFTVSIYERRRNHLGACDQLMEILRFRFRKELSRGDFTKGCWSERATIWWMHIPCKREGNSQCGDRSSTSGSLLCEGPAAVIPIRCWSHSSAVLLIQSRSHRVRCVQSSCKFHRSWNLEKMNRSSSKTNKRNSNTHTHKEKTVIIKPGRR